MPGDPVTVQGRGKGVIRVLKRGPDIRGQPATLPKGGGLFVPILHANAMHHALKLVLRAKGGGVGSPSPKKYGTGTVLTLRLLRPNPTPDQQVAVRRHLG
mmetsp:Transcript_99019/g.170504  ORF Transcript_99019/g.170504 Transcript_99019/m.170504 type:complete len:100 (-) Transcript_99019:2444-2743(-)